MFSSKPTHSNKIEIFAVSSADGLPGFKELREAISTRIQNKGLFPHLGEHLRQSRHIERRGLQDVKCDALRRLRPNTGKPTELVDEVLDDAVVHAQPNLVGDACGSSRMKRAPSSWRTTASP